MSHSEDYLDSLLDSLNDELETESESEKILITEDPVEQEGSAESQFLDDFEKDLAMEMKEGEDAFLREFEKDLGIEPSHTEPLVSLDDILGQSVEPESDTSSVISDIGDILGEAIQSDDDLNIGEIPTTLDQKDDILDSLTDIINSTDEDKAVESEGASEDELTDIMEETEPESNDGEADEPAAESDDGIISDIDGDEPASGVPEDSTESEGSEATGEEATEAGEDTGEGADISEDEVLNIGELLDSIDEEGNLDMPDDTPGEEVVDESLQKKKADVEGEEGQEEEEKKGFLAKLLGKLFKKKEKPEEEEEKEEVKEEAEPVDKAALKAAKKEEKARKKKEKEEAKKAAKAEKEAAKKDKPPKEKKPKKPKAPDNSPKIPIKVLFVFLLLSGSLIALWFVSQKTLSYTLYINSAQSDFDHGKYFESYNTLSGMEIEEEEDMQLVARAKLMATLDYFFKAYEIYVGNEDIRAIDALVRGTDYYLNHDEEADALGIPSEFNTLGQKLSEELMSRYSVTEKDARLLMEIKDRKEYTRELYHILEREGLWSLE